MFWTKWAWHDSWKHQDPPENLEIQYRNAATIDATNNTKWIFHFIIYFCKYRWICFYPRILTISNLSPTCSRQSFCAAPPSMILVTYMLLSPGMCWFPTPPAILKPSPVKENACWYTKTFNLSVWIYTDNHDHHDLVILILFIQFRNEHINGKSMRVCAVTPPHLWVLWRVWSRWWSPASACGAARTAGRWSRQPSGPPPPCCGKLPTRLNHSPAGCSHLLCKTNSRGFTDKYSLVNN